MAQTNSIARSLQEVGLATWFGGSLMGAIGVNGAAAEVDRPEQRARVANAGWARWTPVNAAAIGAYLAGSTVLLGANRGRLASQAGVARTSALNTGLMVAALAATGYSRVLGRRMQRQGDVPVESGTVPSAWTPPEVERAQRQLRYLQWVIPALTGGMLITGARLGEQQRPAEVASGVLRRLNPFSG